MGKKIPSDPEAFTVRDGVTYLFSSARVSPTGGPDQAQPALSRERFCPPCSRCRLGRGLRASDPGSLGETMREEEAMREAPSRARDSLEGGAS
jgi:hypothetical protein